MKPIADGRPLMRVQRIMLDSYAGILIEIRSSWLLTDERRPASSRKGGRPPAGWKKRK